MAGTINQLDVAFEKSNTSERRFGERRPAPTLAVFYWNGGTPTPHRIRDISLSGVYLVTREELLPGAMILLTLQREDLEEAVPDRWIAVHALVVRRDPDGVALSFVFPRSRQSRLWKVDLANGATRLEVAAFLSKLFEVVDRQIQALTPAPPVNSGVTESGSPEQSCSRRLGKVGTSKVCVCNLSRERLVSLNMSVIDTVPTPLKTILDNLSEVSESGLWLTPFRGIPCGRGLSRFDVMFLDDNHRIAECVEGFAVAESGSFQGKHASAVVVPSGAICSSQIQVGDQLRICSPGSRANNLSNWRAIASSCTQREEVFAEQLHCLRTVVPLIPKPRVARTGEAMHLSTQNDRDASLDWSRSTVKTRLLRWFFPGIKPPDRRRAERVSVQEVLAYYCKGGPPTPDRVGNVSGSGFFLITDERWLPGTRIAITLQMGSRLNHDCANWGRVESEVVRWGEDGVGFEFVEPKDAQILNTYEFDQSGFEQFLAEVMAAERGRNISVEEYN